MYCNTRNFAVDVLPPRVADFGLLLYIQYGFTFTSPLRGCMYVVHKYVQYVWCLVFERKLQDLNAGRSRKRFVATGVQCHQEEQQWLARNKRTSLQQYVATERLTTCCGEHGLQKYHLLLKPSARAVYRTSLCTILLLKRKKEQSVTLPCTAAAPGISLARPSRHTLTRWTRPKPYALQQ